MKALMNLAKQKRQQESNQPSSISQKSNMSKFKQAPSQMSQQPEDFDEEYEPQIEQIIAYAEFIDIKLPEEEDLLWIAKQGLQAELPPDWEEAETQTGQIAYTNVRTGQIMFEHPCDDYYRQLVIKERKKMGSKISAKSNQSGGSFKPIGMVSSKAQPIRLKEPEPIVDPLVKMQREKEQKKLQQQKRKQYDDKKLAVKKKYEQKREEIEKQYKSKEDKSRTRFSEELQKQKKRNMEKMSQDQKEQERKKEEQIRQYEKQVKEREERELQDRIKKEKEKLDKKYQQRRDQIKNQLEKKLKDDKRQIDEIYKEKYRQLQNRQKAISQQASQISSNALLEQEISTMKSQIIRKKLAKYSEKLKLESEKQKALYAEEIQKLQSAHNARVKDLQQKSSTESFSLQSNQKLEQLIKEVEAYEKEELKMFEYELEVMKQMKKFEMEEKVEDYKMKLSQLHKEKLSSIGREMEREFDKFKEIKEEELHKILIETEKKAKQDFLNGLKQLQKKFIQEQEITLLENRASTNKGPTKASLLQKQNLESLNRMYEQLEFKQKQLRKERENIKLEIENLRSQSHVANPMLKMNEQQVKLYQLIQDKIRDGYKSK